MARSGKGREGKGRQEKREAEELLKEATRNPQTSHRSTSFLIRSTYGMYPVAERSPCLCNAWREMDKSFLIVSTATFLVVRSLSCEHLCLSNQRYNQKYLNSHVLHALVHARRQCSFRPDSVTVSRRGEQRNFYRSSPRSGMEWHARNVKPNCSPLDDQMTSRYCYRPCLVIIDPLVIKVYNMIPLTTWLTKNWFMGLFNSIGFQKLIRTIDPRDRSCVHEKSE